MGRGVEYSSVESVVYVATDGVLYLHYTSPYYSHGGNRSAVFKCP